MARYSNAQWTLILKLVCVHRSEFPLETVGKQKEVSEFGALGTFDSWIR